MLTQFDVAVLGGGVAGTAAAIAAAQRGANVCLIAGVPGATAMFAGAWCGPCPEALRRALADAGYALESGRDALPHPSGEVIESDYAHASHRAARLSANPVVVGIAGLGGFDAFVLARLWSARVDRPLGVQTLLLAGTPSGGWSAASLAAQLDRTPELLGHALQPIAQTQPVSHFIVPAVLGTGVRNDTYERVCMAAGVTVGEALGGLPSLPGWRLHRALRAAAQRSGVTVVEGRALIGERVDTRVNTVMLAHGNAISARAFVLATGKFAAGGLEADTSFREPAFDCPVWADHLGEQFETVEPLLLTDPVRTQDQPLMRVGVHTDAEQRPLSAAGDIVYRNVIVAGSIRTEWSVSARGIGEASMDGWTAGEKAATI